MGLITTPTTLHTPKHVCTDGSSSSSWEDILSFDKSIYRVFSMQDDMKTLHIPPRIKTEFDRFLDESIKKTNNVGYNTAFDSLNEYLGTIGVANGIC